LLTVNKLQTTNQDKQLSQTKTNAISTKNLLTLQYQEKMLLQFLFGASKLLEQH